MNDTDPREDDVSGRRRRTEPSVEEDNEALSTSPFAGDLDTELARIPRSRRLPGLTTYLVAGVLLAAGFTIGTLADRHFGQHGAQAGPAAGPGGPPAFLGGGRAPGTFGGGADTAGQTTGTIDRIDGKTIDIRTANGATVHVKIAGDTTIRTLRNGSAKDLKPGTSIVVQGPQAQDGTVTATSISPSGVRGG